jgi:polyisoprenoid-binding protein YceI
LAFSPICMAQQPLDVTTSKISFTIKNGGWPVNGTLGKLKAALSFDPNQPEKGQLEATVNVETLETGVGARDRHLKKPEYFDVVKYPTIRLVSTSIRRENKGYTGKFLLTLKGIERPVTIPFTYITAPTGNHFGGAFTINRRDFNVGGSSWVLSDEVKVEINVDVAK